MSHAGKCFTADSYVVLRAVIFGPGRLCVSFLVGPMQARLQASLGGSNLRARVLLGKSEYCRSWRCHEFVYPSSYDGESRTKAGIGMLHYGLYLTLYLMSCPDLYIHPIAAYLYPPVLGLCM